MDTPVVFLVFNRPELTRRVFAAIRAAQPRQLLVVADGPRADRVGERELCEETLQLIRDGLDWKCETFWNVSVQNLGCALRVSSGIAWAFEKVEAAVILEDDCLPETTFFPYCEELLVRYRNEDRVRMISGCNFQPPGHRGTASYYFSRCVHIWGWATWRRAWQGHYDLQMRGWTEDKRTDFLRQNLQDEEQAATWEGIFSRAAGGKIDTWDFAWMYACMRDDGLSALPAVNLISNIGFGANATHTSTHYSPMAECPTRPLSFPLLHPSGSIQADRAADRRTFKLVFHAGTRWQRWSGKLRWALRHPRLALQVTHRRFIS